MDLSARQELLRLAVAHAPELTRFLRRRVSDSETAKDLMQEVYLALLKVRKTPEIRYPKAYFFAIASHVLHQHQRRNLAAQCDALDDEPTQPLLGVHPAYEASGPESEAVLAERLSEVGKRLSQLPTRVSAAVLWHHLEGYTCEEIAEKLEVVRNRVKKYLVRGLRHCRAECVAEAAE